jgi:hypothetical protein
MGIALGIAMAALLGVGVGVSIDRISTNDNRATITTPQQTPQVLAQRQVSSYRRLPPP